MLQRWSFRYAAYNDEEEDWDLSTLNVVNAQLERYVGTLPGGPGDLTLAELQEMAARQQQQMEAQQQVLVAKEQRLKYLKQQEAKHAQLASESERLRRIRERVESQELKLKKLRALRGQAEQYRSNNGTLNSELDAVKAVFNEKEKELAMAVARVDQLTRQLKELRNGVNSGVSGNKQAAAIEELQKLRKELVIRNKINEQQSNTIAAKEKMLSQGRDDLLRMDSRIHELQQRLKKKRQQESQNSQVPSKQVAPSANNKQANPQGLSTQVKGNRNTNAPEPYIKYAPQDIAKDDSYSQAGTFKKQDPKYQTLPSNVKFVPPQRPGEERIGQQQPQQQLYETNNNNDVFEEYKLPTVLPADPGKTNLGNNAPTRQVLQQPNRTNNNDANKPNQNHVVNNVDRKTVSNRFSNISKADVARIGQPFANKFYPSGESQQTQRANSGYERVEGEVVDEGQVQSSSSSSSHPIININEVERQAGSGQSSPASSEGSDSSGGIRLVKNDDEQPQQEVNTESIGSVSAMIQRLNKGKSQKPEPPSVPSATLVGPSTTNRRTRSPRNETDKQGSSAPAVGTKQNGQQQPQVSAPSTHYTMSGDANSSKPSVHPASSVPSQPSQRTSTANADGSANAPPSHTPPQLNVKPAPTYRYASKNQIANTYMGRLGGAAMERYQQNMNMLYNNVDLKDKKKTAVATGVGQDQGDAGQGKTQTDKETTPSAQGHFGMVGPHDYPDIASDKGSYKLNTPKQVRRRHSDSENEDLNKALQEREEVERRQEQQHQTKNSSGGESKTQKNAQTSSTSSSSSSSALPSSSSSPSSTPTDQTTPSVPGKDRTITPSTTKTDKSNGNKKTEPVSKTSSNEAKTKEKSDPNNANVSSESSQNNETKANVVVRRGKSNLKKESNRKSKNRVSFDPLALLLDASLEGELDLVKKVAVQVENVSTPNDEGITALHNAICAGHYEIVKFLIEFGCDVNSPDSDGWTPLHCAASCNNLPMVRFLVEHGACVFATTISDHETAADKCEEDEDGYDGCSDYLYSIQEKLGITKNGEVYAVFDYTASNSDELSFTIGDKLMVLRKGDETEKEWWWAKFQETEGYIPRNLLGLFPRVIQQPNEVSEC